MRPSEEPQREAFYPAEAGCQQCDGTKAEEAADALKLTAKDLLELGVIDTIIPEPLGGAHRNRQAAIDTVGSAIEDALDDFSGIDGAALKTLRREKFLEMGSRGLS